MPDDFTNSNPKAVLALANGAIFRGFSMGAAGETVGEVVFNTAMSGYQEVLTDPSYREQIVTFTYPHIGNVGVNSEDTEANSIHAKGLVIRDQSQIVSNWRADDSLENYLIKNNIVAIAGIDTRRLTRILRDEGAQSGCILVGDDAEKALKKAREFAGLQDLDLAQDVSTNEIYEWRETSVKAAEKIAHKQFPLHVVAYDFGVKHTILRLFKDRGCKITVIPAKTPASEVLKLKPDLVFLSNGPGDPAACDYAIKNTKEFLEKDIPVFGICLGFQILALALNAKTLKMKFGHHGANHPVQDLRTKKVFITSQNHGFMVDEKTLPPELEVTHISLFDGSLQGIKHKTKKAFAFQGHPEASPGPLDIQVLFDEFLEII